MCLAHESHALETTIQNSEIFITIRIICINVLVVIAKFLKFKNNATCKQIGLVKT